MSKEFKKKPFDELSIILSEHPDWDNEDIAEEVLAMPEMDD